uniref:Uncharacterized protein n=1 Tax=Aegilops tauschii subsp. strangulata TaxID=200361 RepID=A0A453KX93_AEGTS
MVQIVEVVTVTWGNLGTHQFTNYCTHSFRTGIVSRSGTVLAFICEENWCVHTDIASRVLLVGVFANSLLDWPSLYRPS